MDSPEDNKTRRAIVARREEPVSYSSRVRASEDREDHETIAVNVSPGEVKRYVRQTVRRELSVSFNPYLSDEELSVLEKYAPGSAARLINATTERVEVNNENLREDGRAKREINKAGQKYAFGVVLAILVSVCYISWLSYPREAASIAIVLLLGLVVSFLVGGELKSVVPWLFQKNNRKDIQTSPPSENGKSASEPPDSH